MNKRIKACYESKESKVRCCFVDGWPWLGPSGVCRVFNLLSSSLVFLSAPWRENRTMLTWAIRKITVQLSDQRLLWFLCIIRKNISLGCMSPSLLNEQWGNEYLVTEHFNLAVPSVYRILSGVFVRVDLDVKRQALKKRNSAYIIDRNLLEYTSTTIKGGHRYITKCTVLILNRMPTLTPFWLLKSVLRQWTATFTWKNKGNRNFIFKFIQARKLNAKSTLNFLWRQRFHILFLCRGFKAEIRHPMRKQGNLTPLIHLKMHLKKLNNFNNCLMA